MKRLLLMLFIASLAGCVTVTDQKGEEWYRVEIPIQVFGLGMGGIVTVLESANMVGTMLKTHDDAVSKPVQK